MHSILDEKCVPVAVVSDAAVQVPQVRPDYVAATSSLKTHPALVRAAQELLITHWFWMYCALSDALALSKTEVEEANALLVRRSFARQVLNSRVVPDTVHVIAC